MKRYLLLITLSILALGANAQLNFSIKAPAFEIGKDDQLTVEYEVTGTQDIANFSEPVFSQWRIISGPNFSSQSFSVNGSTELRASFLYILVPLNTGKLTLPGASMEANGKRLSCSSRTVTVKKVSHLLTNPGASTMQMPGGFVQQEYSTDENWDQLSVLKKGEKPANKIRDNFFVRAFASKQSCVVGEPIMITYKRCSRLQSASRITKQPVFSGCSVDEMTTEGVTPGIESIDGKDYRTDVIRKVQLTPLQAGDLVIDTLAIESDITLYEPATDASGKFQGSFQPHIEHVLTASKPLVIHVSELPAANKPKDFNNCVGAFSISAKAAKTNDTANENNSVIITIEGRGNFQTVSCPAIQWPANTQHFETATRDDINKMVFPSEGSKTFEIPFITKEAGKVVIPSLHFNYYDIDARQYKSLQTDSIVIMVSAAVPHSIDVAKLSQDITNRKYIWFVPGIALVAGVCLWWMYGRKEEEKPTISSAAITTIVPEEPATEVVTEPVPAAPAVTVGDIISIEDSKEFYAAAKKWAAELYTSSSNEAQRSLLQNITRQCDEALYFPAAAIDKATLSQLLQEAAI